MLGAFHGLASEPGWRWPAIWFQVVGNSEQFRQ